MSLSIDKYESLIQLSLLLAIFIEAAFTCHIDDTDETFGYWEPLHYLLYGSGMQTWEYSPRYAIRSYAFISPMAALCSLVMQIYSTVFPHASIVKVNMFYSVKVFLGFITAIAVHRLLESVRRNYSTSTHRYAFVFLAFSAGIRLASVAYLPSAVGMSLVMLSTAAFLDNQFNSCIAWGSIAVLCTGWPFIGVLVLPLGIAILSARWMSGGISGVIKQCFSGIAIVVSVVVFSSIMDRYYYGTWTSPSLNILLYNAGSNKDLLYGVEPPSYYVKNLILNMGFAPFLAALNLPALAIKTLYSSSEPAVQTMKRLAVLFSGLLWLGVLFSRAHKEERFLYPAFPHIAIAAAETCDTIISSLTLKTKNYISNKQSSQTLPLVIISTAAMAMFASRSYSNYNNYGGYLNSWKQFSEVSGAKEAIVCLGREWYYFPSHFFLPTNYRLEFIDDGFGGQLPHHFSKAIEMNGSSWVHSGTSAIPTIPFNDDNLADPRVYVSIDQCDYVVALSRELDDGLRTNLASFDQIYSNKVLDQSLSTSALARSFYLPFYSARHVYFKDYNVYRRKSELKTQQ